MKKDAKEIPWIQSLNPAQRSFVTILPNENNEPKGPQATLSLDETVHQNAQRHFEAARKQKDKTKGAVEALEETILYLQRAKKEKKKNNKQVENSTKSSEVSDYGLKTIDGLCLAEAILLVGGKDAKGNDAIVKKHLSGSDMYLHADLHGAPSCSLRANTRIPPPTSTKPAHIT